MCAITHKVCAPSPTRNALEHPHHAAEFVQHVTESPLHTLFFNIYSWTLDTMDTKYSKKSHAYVYTHRYAGGFPVNVVSLVSYCPASGSAASPCTLRRKSTTFRNSLFRHLPSTARKCRTFLQKNLSSRCAAPLTPHSS